MAFTLSPLIYLVIPALPFFVGLIKQWIPASRQYIHKINSKLIYYPEYFIDLSYGGAFLLLLHGVLMILVGISKFHSSRHIGLNNSRSLAVSTGYVNLMNFWLLTIPSSKTASILSSKEARLSYTRLIKYHQVIGCLAIITGCIHLTVNCIVNSQIIFTRVILFGLIAFIISCLIVSTSIEPFRRLQYDTFQRIHHLSLAIVILIILHTRSALNGFLPGIILHGFDAMIKICSYLYPKKPTEIGFTKGSSKIVSLNIPVSHYWPETPNLGSFYYIHIPDISVFEWHPFSVAKYDDQTSTVTIHVKAMEIGSFTDKLYNYALQQSAADNEAAVVLNHRTSLLGPFGNLSINLEDYCHIILIAGGIGVTPMWLILDDVIHYVNGQHANPSVPNDIQSNHSSNGASWLKKWSSRQLKYTKLVRITLAWTYRGEDIKQLFSTYIPDESTFPNLGQTIPPQEPSIKKQEISLEYRLYDTIEKVEAKTDVNVNSTIDTDTAIVKLSVNREYGRPNIPDIVQKYQGEKFGNTCIVACGPQGLISSARSIGNELGIDTHFEHFQF